MNAPLLSGAAAALLLVPFAAAQQPAAVALPAAPDVRGKVAAIHARIDRARLETDVRMLASFGTRHVLSRTDSETEGRGAAQKWLQAQYEAIAAASGGRLAVTVQRAVVPCARPQMPREVEIVNIIATLRGATDPERTYLVGGHYDSRNGDGSDGTRPAPGASDDASGTAAALEACRAMAATEFPATLVFVAYDAEEQGLLGSKAHAEALAAAGTAVDGMITCDIVGNTLGMDGTRNDGWLRCFSYAPTGLDSHGRSLARAAAYAARTHVPGFELRMVFRGDRFGRGGDHRSFFEQGFPAVRFSEAREDFSRQHQDLVEKDGKPYGDVPDFVDFAYVANVTRVVTATLAELASAPRPPRAVSAQLRRDRYDTELVYELPSPTDAHEFVWRETTAPDWTHAIASADADVKPARAGRFVATLRGVCLDDVVVGVRTIGKDGSRSRVVVPPEPDRFEQRRQAPREGERGGGR